MVTWIYSAIMLVSIASCSVLLRRFQQTLPVPPEQKLLLGISAFCGAMIGAKIPFVIMGNDSIFLGTSWLSNGKTIMFGIVGGYAMVTLTKWVLGIRVRTGDSYAFPVAVAIAIGRLSCFAAGCCHGTPTTLPWGVHFSAVDGDSPVFRHPIQIYETLFHSISAILILLAYRHLYRREQSPRTWFDLVFHGNLLKVYILTYWLYRFLTEFIRPEPDVVGTLSYYQLFALLMIPIFSCIWGWDVWLRFHPRNHRRSEGVPNRSD